MRQLFILSFTFISWPQGAGKEDTEKVMKTYTVTARMNLTEWTLTESLYHMALCHLNVFMWTCFIQGVLHCNKNTCNTALKPRRGRNKCETRAGNLRVCASVRGTYYRAAMCERGLTVPHVCSLTDSGASLPLCGRKVAGVTAHIGWQETQRGCNKALIHLFILNGRTVLAHPSSLTH